MVGLVLMHDPPEVKITVTVAGAVLDMTTQSVLPSKFRSTHTRPATPVYPSVSHPEV